jgi:hypothetical protein
MWALSRYDRLLVSRLSEAGYPLERHAASAKLRRFVNKGPRSMMNRGLNRSESEIRAIA